MSPTAGTVWASSTKTVGRTDRRPTAIARCAILCANVPTTTTKASKPNLPNSLTGLIRRTFLIGRAHRRTKSLALTDHDPIPQTLPPVSELRLIISPLLANVYLHFVLDVWIEHEVKPRLHGKVFLIRYADDAVLCFQYREDAEKVLSVLPKRFAKYGLTLHPEK